MKNRTAKQQKYARLLQSTSIDVKLSNNPAKRTCTWQGDRGKQTQTVLLDQAFFGLNREKIAQFTALLDAPPAANPGLARLMSVKAPWPSSKA